LAAIGVMSLPLRQRYGTAVFNQSLPQRENQLIAEVPAEVFEEYSK
jgi:hypothetical protein